MNRQVAALLLVVCCGLSSLAEGQVLETSIELPDTLGPLNGPYCLAWDDNPAHPRLYIGGVPGCESTGVIVADAITCKRLARIPTGPVRALCFVPSHRKLYVAKLNTDSVEVVDCASNQVVSAVHVAGEVPVMLYNRQNDRLYCGGDQVSAIDCAGDTVIHTIAMAATAFAFDSTNNKLYAGCNGPLAVIDCTVDSVVATVPRVDSAGAIIYNPSAGKVYAISGDTLFAIGTGYDSIVAKLYFGGLVSMLTCNPERNCVYYAYGDNLGSVDCAADTVVLESYTNMVPYFLACNVDRDLVYFGSYCSVVVLNGTTGQILSWVTTQSSSGCGWSPGLDRLFCPPALHETPPAQLCLLAAVDGSGDTLAGFLPLTLYASSLTLDTVHNRLYFAYPSLLLGCIGAVDCSRGIVAWYKLVGGAKEVCYNPNNNRLYWSTRDRESGLAAVVVFDCAAESVVKTVPVAGEVWTLKLHTTLNKLYVEGDGSPHCVVSVIDCKYDTLVRRIPLAVDHYPRKTLLVAEDNRYWYLGARNVVVVDCRGDTVIADVSDTLGSVDDACACPEDRKIYAGWGGRPTWVVDMDDPAHVETLYGWIPDAGMRFCNVPGAHKAYWCVNCSGNPPGNSRFYVIDTRTSTITDSFWAGRQVSGMCLDHTGNYVYCTGYLDPAVLLILDTRRDTVIDVVDLPCGGFGPPLLNRATNRVYPSASGNPIPVVHDSMLIGLEELKPTEHTLGVSPTLVNRSVPFRSTTLGEVYDATGRRVAVLWQGPNDMRHLAPGVYFVRPKPSAVSRQPLAVTKVVLTE